MTNEVWPSRAPAMLTVGPAHAGAMEAEASAGALPDSAVVSEVAAEVMRAPV